MGLRPIEKFSVARSLSLKVVEKDGDHPAVSVSTAKFLKSWKEFAMELLSFSPTNIAETSNLKGSRPAMKGNLSLDRFRNSLT